MATANIWIHKAASDNADCLPQIFFLDCEKSGKEAWGWGLLYSLTPRGKRGDQDTPQLSAAPAHNSLPWGGWGEEGGLVHSIPAPLSWSLFKKSLRQPLVLK